MKKLMSAIALLAVFTTPLTAQAGRAYIDGYAVMTGVTGVGYVQELGDMSAFDLYYTSGTVFGTSLTMISGNYRLYDDTVGTGLYYGGGVSLITSAGSGSVTTFQGVVGYEVTSGSIVVDSMMMITSVGTGLALNVGYQF